MSHGTEQSSLPSFQVEIMCMLHAFGDVKEPQKETAELIENIVYSQMCSLLVIASDTALLRGSSSVGVEEFLYLLRRNDAKLARMLYHLQFKDMKNHLTKSLDSEASENVGDQDAPSLNVKQNKRLKTHEEFLKTLDSNGMNLLAILKNSALDEVRLKRQERAEKQTRHMDSEQYMYFSNCRAMSFSKKLSKFCRWFEQFLPNVDIKPSNMGWEVISYLAYETVAEIVDVALLVQKEQQDTACWPAHQLAASSTEAFSVHKQNISVTSSQESLAETDKQSSIIKKSAVSPSHIREVLRRYLFSGDNSNLFPRKMGSLYYGHSCAYINMCAKLICLA